MNSLSRTEQQVETTVSVMVKSQVQAWIAERASDAQVRRLQSQRRLDEERATTAEAAWQGRRRVTEAALKAQAVSAEYHFQASIRHSSSQVRQESISRELEAEHLLGLREEKRRKRLIPPAGGELPLLPPAISGAEAGAAAGGALTVQISDQTIESLALRAVTRFSQLSPAVAEHAWAAWQAEVRKRLPAYAAAEVIRRADQMRGLAG